MSDKRALRERSQGFRRRMRGEKKAVSPVVATLILILIAVAAAAALYLWLVAWQGNITGGIGNQGAQATVTIGGSTSVYPFSSLAVSWFEQNHSDVVISDSQGGTGAGMLAVCQGHVDVGAASSPETVSGLQSADGCPLSGTITITTIAYDAVDVLVSTSPGSPAVASVSNTAPLLSINQTVLLGIYLADSTGVPTLAMPTYDHVTLGLTTGAGVKWSEIPTTAGCGNAPAPACVFVTDTNYIQTVSRSDASGTTQAFEARLLGATSATATATTVSGLGFSGCGSNNLLADCGITTNKTANGNPGVITAVAGTVNAIGYASDGLVRAAGSGVNYVDFAAPGQTPAALASYTSGVSNYAVVPSLSATGTIASGITGTSTTVAPYAGWRPFEFVTLNPPTGEVQVFFTFITDPANNQALATATGEVSIYSI